MIIKLNNICNNVESGKNENKNISIKIYRAIKEIIYIISFLLILITYLLL